MTGATAGPQHSGPARTVLTCCAIAIVGLASSLLLTALAMLAVFGRVGFGWQEALAMAAGHLVLAAWCLHVVRRGRCDLERRIYLAPTVGVVSLVVTALVFEVSVGSAAGGGLAMLWFLAFTGYPVWVIGYAGLALWALCRRAGHPRGLAPASLYGEQRGGTT